MRTSLKTLPMVSARQMRLAIICWSILVSQSCTDSMTSKALEHTSIMRANCMQIWRIVPGCWWNWGRRAPWWISHSKPCVRVIRRARALS